MSVPDCALMGLRKEVVPGTDPGGTYDGTEFENESLAGQGGILTRDVINGKKVANGASVGPFSTAGGVAMLTNPEGMLPRAMEGLFGNDSVVEAPAGVHTHTFSSTGCSILPSYSFYVDRLTGKFVYTGCKFDALDLSIDAGGQLKAGFSIVGMKEAETAVKTVTLHNDRPFVWADCSVLKDGDANTNLETLSMNFTNAIEPIFTLNGTRFPGKISEAGFAISGSFTEEFDSMDSYRKFWGSAVATEPLNTVYEGSLVFTCTSTENIGATATPYQMIITLNGVIYQETSAPLSFGERIVSNVSFIGVQPENAALEAATISIRNGEASY